MTVKPTEPAAIGMGQFPEDVVRGLVEKGFTPRTNDGPLGKAVSWEKPVANVDYWPMVALAIAFLLFVLFMVKGVPWA